MYLVILFIPFYITLSAFQSGETELEALPSHDTDKLKIQIQKSLERISRMEEELKQIKEDVFSLKHRNDAGDIKTQWEADIIPLCRRTIEGRYPFSEPNQRDSALGDVHYFFHPESLLWKFFENELKQYIHQSHDKWEVVTYKGQPLLPLTPQSLEWLRTTRFISESLGSLQVNFSLLPYPDQGPSAMVVQETRLTIGGQTLGYQMGHPEWKDLIWPGAERAEGATLQVNVNGRWETLEFQGSWGWFRLLENAQLTPIDDRTFKVLWKFESQGGLPLQIRYDLKVDNAWNPFLPGLLSKFSCLQSLW